MSTTQISMPTLSWESLQEAKPWRELTPQQRAWCLAWLSNGRDPVAATALAYRCSSPKNTACLSYEVRRNKNVVAFLELCEVLTQGAPSREVQIAGLLEAIRNSPPYAQVRARQLLAELTGCVSNNGQAEEPTTDLQPSSNSQKTIVTKVGDVVLVDGVPHRVTATDENGRPTEGEPV